jgi:hypothetical protein
MSDSDEKLSNSSMIAAVQTCKLPPFWPEDPTTWIEQVEAQFHLRHVTADSTKFYHLVAALDPSTARRLRDTIKNAPNGSRYEALKTHLISTFSLTESERANRLLNLRGLGARKPSELMDEMTALLEGQTPCFIFKQLFINQLPESLQVQMATVEFENTREFALKADQFWNAKISADQNSSNSINRVMPNHFSEKRQQPRRIPINPESLCYYHTRYGSNAHKCQQPCSFSGKVQADRQ